MHGSSLGEGKDEERSLCADSRSGRVTSYPATPVEWAAQGHESLGPTRTAAAALAKPGPNAPGLPRGALFAEQPAWHLGSHPDSGSHGLSGRAGLGGGGWWCREQTQRCGSPASSRRPGKELSGETVQCGHTETSTEAGPVPGPLQLSKGCSQQPAMPGPRSARSGRTPGRTPPLCRRLKGTTELVGSHTSQVPAPAFLGEAWPRTIKGCSRLS